MATYVALIVDNTHTHFYKTKPGYNEPSLNPRFDLEGLNEDTFIKLLACLTVQDKKSLRQDWVFRWISMQSY